MIKRLVTLVKNLLRFPQTYNSLINHYASKEDIESLKIQNGRIWHEINKVNASQIIDNVQLAEFKVFSQFGDDGIIQFLINHLAIQERTFIEFGVENYKESNTRFLLINNNWKGLIMDGSDSYMNQIKNEEIYWKYDITAVPVFITKENINSIIENNGFTGEVGLLHIDIDGNDYWIWEELKVVLPIIIIVEYNSVLGSDRSITVPYDSKFYRTNAHYSNLYYGSSLPALCDLADKKGYFFVGCNSNGNNAYFIRKDKIQDIKALTAKEGYVESKFKESRDINGILTHLSGIKRYEEIKGLKIYNTKTQQTETL